MANSRFTFIAYLIVVLQLFALQVSAQTISGTVVDADGSFPLKGATVLVPETSNGTHTDSLGQFTLLLPAKSKQLVVSFVGYKTDTLQLSVAGKYIVRLQRIFSELPMFTLSSTTPQLVYEKLKTYVVDYEPIGDNFLLLVKEGRKKYLRLVDEHSATLAQAQVKGILTGAKLHGDIENNRLKQQLLSGNNALYRDFDGHIHLVGTDSTYQLLIRDDHILMYPAISFAAFQDMVLQCRVAFGQELIFVENGAPSNYNQQITYFAINTGTNEKTVVTQVLDASMREASAYYEAASIKMAGGLNRMGNISITQLRQLRDAAQLWDLHYIYSQPPYVPIKKFRNMLVLFDHVNNKLVFYNKSLLPVTEVPIEYHLARGWEKEVIISEDGMEIYLRFSNNGIISLYRLDPESGKVTAQYQLKEQNFPEKIRVRDGFAYYLYLNKGDNLVKLLYRQHLE